MAKCSAKGCSVKNAVFAYHKSDEFKYCKAHSSEGMIDVKNKKCARPDCDSQPVFAYHKSDEFKYCKNHAAGDMIDVISKRCSHPGCDSQPVFAYHKSDEFKYCKNHAAGDMIDVKNVKCSSPGCKSQSVFAYRKSDEFKYCKKHAAGDMIDVISKRCARSDCDSINPVFAYHKSDEFKYCKAHSVEGMIDVIHKRCSHPDCESRPYFAYRKSDEFKYCKAHSVEGMIDVKNKRCVSCGLFRAEKSKDYMCSQCFMFNNPDHEFSRHYKTKELTFTRLLQQDLSEQGIECVLDSKISGGCSRRRPDVFIDMLTHVLIIEIDENQHLSYNESCEYVRTIELNEDIGHRPMYIIRLNPDSYKLDGKSVRGCFNSKMELNKKEFGRRYSTLLSTVLDLTATPPERLIDSIELFFTESE